MTEPISINLVLLLLERGASEELGPALWAAFKEVEAFYNLDMKRAKFRLFNISKPVPKTRDRSIVSRVWDFVIPDARLGNKRKEKQEISKERGSWKTPTPEQLQGVKGKFSRTVNAEKILRLVGELLPDQHADAQVTVIDQELTPPPDWRYVIWDRRVISTVPTDPQYWGMKDPDRIAIIKHRVRTACLSNVGSLIGLGRCANESCFLYRNVDSVMCLDGLVKLGPEHAGVAALEGRGFEILSSDPGAMQPIVVDPMPKRGFYER